MLDFREGALFEAHDHSEHDDHDDHGKKDDHDDHEKGSHRHMENMKVIPLSGPAYLSTKRNIQLVILKGRRQYADPAMKMVILEASDIETVEEKAEALFESSSFETKKHNEQLVAQEKSFSLNFDSNKNMTVFKIKIEQSGSNLFYRAYAF